MFFGKVHAVLRAHMAVVFQSLHGTGPQISQRWDFADEDFCLVLFQAVVLSFPGYLLDVA